MTTTVKTATLRKEQLVNCHIHALKDEPGTFVINARGGVVPPKGGGAFTSTRVNQVLGKVVSVDVEIGGKKETIKPGELAAKTEAGAIAVGLKYSAVKFTSDEYFALSRRTDFAREVEFKLPFELQLRRD